MPEYIEREALIQNINEGFEKTDPRGEEQIGFMKCRRIAREIPAADVEPVRHGRWIYEAETIYTKSGYRCSVCRTPLWFSPDVPQAFTYCPNCGAKMDGGDTNA